MSNTISCLAPAIVASSKTRTGSTSWSGPSSPDRATDPQPVDKRARRFHHEESVTAGSRHMNDMPRITQEMINLYDEYTHVTLDRPGFLDRLTALTGSPEVARSLAALIE